MRLNQQITCSSQTFSSDLLDNIWILLLQLFQILVVPYSPLPLSQVGPAVIQKIVLRTQLILTNFEGFHCSRINKLQVPTNQNHHEISRNSTRNLIIFTNFKDFCTFLLIRTTRNVFIVRNFESFLDKPDPANMQSCTFPAHSQRFHHKFVFLKVFVENFVAAIGQSPVILSNSNGNLYIFTNF